MKKHLVISVILACVAIFIILILFIQAIIGVANSTDGCLYRYNFLEDGSYSASDKIVNTVTLRADGNYSFSGSNQDEDPNNYNQWLNTNLRVKNNEKINFTIIGEVSLCRAYLPEYNLQNDSGIDVNDKPIAIPRVEETLIPPVTIFFDAKRDSWRNLAQLFRNDKISVSLLKDQKTELNTTSVYHSINSQNISADCSEEKKTYSPICGRYSIRGPSEPYVTQCRWEEKCYECNCKEVCVAWTDIFWCGNWETVCEWCGCYQNVYSTPPEPYFNDGRYTKSWSDNISSLKANLTPDCRTNHTYVENEYLNNRFFWFSADDATGLLYRLNGNLNPTNSPLSGTFEFAKISDQESESPNANVIFNKIYSEDNISYLQYRLYSDGNSQENTGGYVFQIRQTKCRRSNGNAFNDTIEARGIVEYIIAPYGKNPNNSSLEKRNIITEADGAGEIQSHEDGYLWMKIKNDPNDAIDSFGEYRIQFFSHGEKKGFYTDILEPLFDGLKTRIKGASETIFKNMTCYGEDKSNCTNFFSYIKAMLILYILLYGMMFLLGMVKISQNDLVIRIIKVGLIAGLINDSTFNFFNSYIFDTVSIFSDNIVANMSGYSLFSGSENISNPFMFLNEVMTKIFLSRTFAAQMMAMLSMGFAGVIYFILVFIALGIVVIVLLRALAVYLMAFFAVAVLIGLAPIFLTFILFKSTRYLFDNWVKFTFRYMLEPVILLAGIIILTQLFTIYLDYVVGYSVCWKCALEFKIPFPQIEGITPAFLDAPLFCINWFGPWGVDYRTHQIGMNMQNIIILLMLAYCMWGYIEFSARIVGRIAGSQGGPFATHMGRNMSDNIENNILSKVGLDEGSRHQIEGEIESRKRNIVTGLRNDSELNKNDIKDMKNPTKSKEKAVQNPTQEK